MQRRTLLLGVVMLGLLAGACVSGTQQTSNGERKKKGPNDRIKIGFSMDTLKEERWQRDKELVTKRAAEIGAELNVQVANGSDSDQIKQAENMLTSGVGRADRRAAQRRDRRVDCGGRAQAGRAGDFLRSPDQEFRR